MVAVRKHLASVVATDGGAVFSIGAHGGGEVAELRWRLKSICGVFLVLGSLGGAQRGFQSRQCVRLQEGKSRG